MRLSLYLIMCLISASTKCWAQDLPSPKINDQPFCYTKSEAVKIYQCLSTEKKYQESLQEKPEQEFLRSNSGIAFLILAGFLAGSESRR